MPVSEDVKRERFGDALKDLGVERGQIIRLLTIFLAEYLFGDVTNHSALENVSEDNVQKILLSIASLLVDESSATDFTTVLPCMIGGPSSVFRTSQQTPF